MKDLSYTKQVHIAGRDNCLFKYVDPSQSHKTQEETEKHNSIKKKSLQKSTQRYINYWQKKKKITVKDAQ